MAKNFVGQEYAAATNGKGLEQSSRGARLLTRLTVTFSVVVIIASVAMIAFCMIFSLSPIKGTSMMMTLNATGHNTDSAITCSVITPNRGDIVIAKMYFEDTGNYQQASSYRDKSRLLLDANGTPIPNDTVRGKYPYTDNYGRYKYVIKRLIAVGGDQIRMERTLNNPNRANDINYTSNDDNYSYALYLKTTPDGAFERLDESYLDPIVAHPSSTNFVKMWRLLNCTYNANNATFSDWHSTTTQNTFEILGHTMTINDAVLNNWNAKAFDKCVDSQTHTMTIPEGYYFLMGDNRNGYPYCDDPGESWDSSALGPFPVKDYVGTCVDVIHEDKNMIHYFWDKTVYYVFFGWLWQK